jgi:hypothetical protein
MLDFIVHFSSPSHGYPCSLSVSNRAIFHFNSHFISTIYIYVLSLLACCNRHSLGCAVHVLVENILSIIAASVLLYFDNIFLNNPYTCYFGSTLCNRLYSGDTIYTQTNYTVKLACIKAQLACAAVMLVTNVIYMIIFMVVAVRTKNESNEIGIYQHGGSHVHVVSQPMVYQQQPPTTYASTVPQQQPQERGSQQRIVECHQCHTLIQIP